MKSSKILLSSCMAMALAMQGCNTSDSGSDNSPQAASGTTSNAFASKVTLEQLQSLVNTEEVSKYIEDMNIDVNNLFVQFKGSDVLNEAQLADLKIENALDVINFIENKLYNGKSLNASRTDRVRLIPVSEKKDNFGNTYYRYTLSYNNLPFFDKDIISQVDTEGTIKIISGQYHQTLSIDTDPSVDFETVAKNISLTLTGTDNGLEYETQPQLGFYEKAGVNYLAYQILVRYTNESSYEEEYRQIFIDAHTGEVLSNINRHHTLNAPVEVIDAGGACQQMGAYGFGGNPYPYPGPFGGGGSPYPYPNGGGSPYPYPYPNGGGSPYPYPYPNGGGSPYPYPYPDNGGRGNPYPYPDNGGGGSGGGSGGEVTEAGDANSNDVGIRAKAYLEESYYFYYHIFGRKSYDNQDSTIIAKVNAKFSMGGQCSGLNAFADNERFFLMFGTGDSSKNVDHMVGQDIVGHEFSHLVTAKESNLKYENESGALNESLSDIFGASIEAWVDLGGGEAGNPVNFDGYIAGDAIWSIGEEFDHGAGKDFHRFMNNPTQDGSSPDNYNNRKTGSDDNGGVHSNSGIFNVAYSLMVTGGEHPSTGKKVNGIGYERAIRIWYHAQTNLFGSSTNFKNARQLLAQSAETLYGESSAEWASVHRAFEAVNVDGSWDDDGVVDADTKSTLLDPNDLPEPTDDTTTEDTTDTTDDANPEGTGTDDTGTNTPDEDFEDNTDDSTGPDVVIDDGTSNTDDTTTSDPVVDDVVDFEGDNLIKSTISTIKTTGEFIGFGASNLTDNDKNTLWFSPKIAAGDENRQVFISFNKAQTINNILITWDETHHAPTAKFQYKDSTGSDVWNVLNGQNVNGAFNVNPVTATDVLIELDDGFDGIERPYNGYGIYEIDFN